MVKNPPRRDPIISDAELDARAVNSARKAVIPKTDARYQDKIWTMKNWLAQRPIKKTRMDAKDFSRFLESHKGGIVNGNSRRTWSTAWKAWRDLEGDSVDPGDPGLGLISRQIKGARYNAGNPAKTSPDAIDSGKLKKLSSLLIKKGEAEYAMAFTVDFYGGFRKEVGAGLKKQDVNFDTDIGTLISSQRNKAATALKAELPGMIGNLKEANNLTKLLQKLIKDKKMTDRIFPNWTDAKANQLIKEAAKELDWGEGKWVVTSLRHGAAREGMALVGPIPNLEELLVAATIGRVAKRLGHTNVKSQIHYQRSNSAKRQKK